MNHYRAYQYQQSPSKAFKEDVLRIVIPFFESFKPKFESPSRQKDAESNEIFIEWNPLNIQSASPPNSEITKRLDSLTQMYNELNKACSKPCDCKWKNIDFDHGKFSLHITTIY